MKLLFDLLPIILFFIAYKLYNIFVATTFAIVAVIAQIGVTLFRKKRPDMMQLVTLVMVIVLGGATLFFRNEMFIKWKPTVVYWLLGAIFAGSQFIGSRTLVQKMLEKSLTLPKNAWILLNTSWYCFFFIMGILNLAVVYLFDTDTWVNYKLFGTLGLTLVFVIIQGILVSRFLPHKSQENNLN